MRICPRTFRTAFPQNVKSLVYAFLTVARHSQTILVNSNFAEFFTSVNSMHTSSACSKNLWLAKHVRACQIDGQVILLDLLKGKYIGVPQIPELADAIGGWPSRGASLPPQATHADVADLSKPLLSAGILTVMEVDRTPSCLLPTPSHSLNAEYALSDSHIGVKGLSRFLLCAANAAMSLRFRSLFSITEAISERRAFRAPEAPSADELRETMVAYDKLRPIVLTANGKCLYDSLTLLNFLAVAHMFPSWVIGVRTRPFAAHSWIQAGGTVLNDQHDHVGQFCPILVA